MSIASDVVNAGFWATLGVIGTGAIGVALQGFFQKSEKEAGIARVYADLLRDSENSRLKLQKRNRWLERQHDRDIRKRNDIEAVMKVLVAEINCDPVLAEKLAATLKAVQDIAAREG